MWYLLEVAPKMAVGAGVRRRVCLQQQRPAWTVVSLTPGSGLRELPPKAGVVGFIRLPGSWRQGFA